MLKYCTVQEDKSIIFYSLERCESWRPTSALLGTEDFLKGPKREKFDFGVFAQIRPIWIGHLGTRPKNYKFGWFRH